MSATLPVSAVSAARNEITSVASICWLAFSFSL
jgi:hypothetical protein